MSQTLRLELHNRQQAWAVIQAQAYPFLKLWLRDGRRLVLQISLLRRSTQQNRRYWGRGVLAQVAEQAVARGQLYSAETWHEQFKRMFIGLIELPNGQVQGMSSAKLTKAEFAEFCDQVEAYAANDLGVVFVDLPEAS